MAVVQMLKAYGSNVAGEVCGVSDELAQVLVSRGIAIIATSAPVEAVTKTMAAPVEHVESPVAVEEVEEKGFIKGKKRKG